MFKPLTKNAEAFINQVVSLTGSSNFSGSLPYALGRSNEVPNTVYTGNPMYRGAPITSAQDYGAALIFWFNQYCEEYTLDANIMAAQVYVESGYRLWEYSNSGDSVKSSAMGITQLYDNEIWDLFFTTPNEEVALPKDQTLYDDQTDIIGLNLSGDITDIRNIVPYLDNSTPETNAIALANRKQLFQNIMNNTEIVIQGLCRFMSEIGDRNNNLAASSLFAYATDGYLASKTYNEVINNAAKANLQVKPGIDYVEKIFKVLGGKYKTSLPGFGKDYVYDNTINDQANKNLSGTVIINQGTNYPPVGNKGTYPEETVRTIVRALEKYGITNQYLQSGILAVISTEGSFFPQSELSYSKTSNDRLRLIFGTRLSNLTENQLTALKANDINFYAAVYEGKFGAAYGNTTFGDGYKYRGRGFNQITFKSLYQRIASVIGVDIVTNPDQLNTISVAAEGVAVYFKDFFDTATRLGIPSKRYGLNSFNDVNDLTLGTRIALQANSGWNKNLNSSIYPEVFKKQMANVGKLHSIALTA